jgi:hypothetical protein
MTTLLKLFSLQSLATVWLVALGLVALFQSPMTLATALLLLMVGLVVPGVVILLRKNPPRTIAEVLNRVERSTIRQRRRPTGATPSRN